MFNIRETTHSHSIHNVNLHFVTVPLEVSDVLSLCVIRYCYI